MYFNSVTCFRVALMDYYEHATEVSSSINMAGGGGEGGGF